ncbi:hypothetical protein PV783_01395 [Chitinophaga sp. CC14]|uniref:hypothetical protein n=1 Tax=Chitinophaga sp. CC14 TaxID=3029199 RepID=UPI003B7BD9F9
MNTPVKNINLKNSALLFFAGVFFFFLTRQVPFSGFSIIMNLFLLLIYFVYFLPIVNNIYQGPSYFRVLLFLLTGLLVFDLFYSICLMNDVVKNIRFFILLILLIYSFYLVPPERLLKIFIAIMLLQAIVIILFSIYLSVFFDLTSYMPIRFFFLEKEWGDVYTYNGWLFIVQIKGNALLPLTLFITYFYPIKRKYLIRGILLIACVVAGNFAYVISMALFYMVYFLRSETAKELIRKIVLLLMTVFVLSIPVYTYYVKPVLEGKQEGSLSTRADQTALLMDDLTQNAGTFLLGTGLGHTVERATYARDYRGDVYFELQVLYVLNQLGVIGFILVFLYVIVLMPLYKFRNKWLLFIYVCYVIYACTNPYIFDSNQIAVILVLNALQNFYDRNPSFQKWSTLGTA